jgi:hypothetical protein
MHDAKKLQPEALEEWREHPVTRFLLDVLRKGEAANKARLQALLWQSGACDPQTLGKAKAAEELIEDLTEATSEEWNDWAEHFEQQRA